MKKFINTKIVLDIESDKVLCREGFEYDGPTAEAVTATAVTKLVEGHFPGAKMEVYSFSIDPGSIAGLAQEIETMTITGARAGDPVLVSLEAPQVGINTQGAKVTANDVVSVYLENNQPTTAIDATAAIGYLTIFKRAIGS